MTTDPAPDDRPPETFGDAIAAHRQRVGDVLPGGDPDEIKKLYVELGSLIDAAVDGDASEVPALSFPEIRPVIDAMSADLRGRILDAGCGPNPIFSIMLAGRVENTVISLDISFEIVRLAVARAQRDGVRVLGVVGDVEALPFRASVIDACICEDTIEHLPDDTKGAEELARVLTPNGRLILGTPNRIRLDVLRAKLRDRLRGNQRPASFYYAASSHLREYTWLTLERVVAPWFTVRARETVGWDGGPRARLMTKLVNRWPFRWVGRMVILDVVPRKAAGDTRSAARSEREEASTMRRYWDERARLNAPWYVDTSLSYDEPDIERFFETGRRIASEALEYAPPTLGRGLAVEIGCGLGRICVALAESFEHVVGVDISAEMLRRAREAAFRPGVSYLLGDGASLGQIKDGVVDLVLTFTVFQHIPSVPVIERYIAEAGRVLRPGGAFVFQWNNTPGGLRWRLRRGFLSLAQRVGVRRERFGRHAPEFLGSRVSMPRVRRALERAGLELDHVRGEGTLYAWGWAVRR